MAIRSASEQFRFTRERMLSLQCSSEFGREIFFNANHDHCRDMQSIQNLVRHRHTLIFLINRSIFNPFLTEFRAILTRENSSLYYFYNVNDNKIRCVRRREKWLSISDTVEIYERRTNLKVWNNIHGEQLCFKGCQTVK